MSALPAGPFDVIVADPPWRYNNTTTALRSGGRGAGAEHHYATLTNDEIGAIPVVDVAADDAHLFLWFTNPFTWGGLRSDLHPALIAKAWGFEFRTVLTWVKTTLSGEVNRGGTGWYFRGCTEHVLYATRGKAKIPTHLREPNVLLAPRSRHSAKPSEFMDMIERVIPVGRRLEMFSRAHRPGWVAWGDEAIAVPVSRPGDPT